MKKKAHNLLNVVFVALLIGCSSSPYITITGEAQPTKDGFYVNGYVLTFEEIEKHNPDYRERDFDGLELQITGKVEEHESESLSNEGELLQARVGKTKYIQHIKTIKIIKE